jgi:hypothetical protein
MVTQKLHKNFPTPRINDWFPGLLDNPPITVIPSGNDLPRQVKRVRSAPPKRGKLQIDELCTMSWCLLQCGEMRAENSRRMFACRVDARLPGALEYLRDGVWGYTVYVNSAWTYVVICYGCWCMEIEASRCKGSSGFLASGYSCQLLIVLFPKKTNCSSSIQLKRLNHRFCQCNSPVGVSSSPLLLLRASTIYM